MSNVTTQILERARDIVANGWTKTAFARDNAGNARSSLDPAATCFCALGAISKAANTVTGKTFSNPHIEAVKILTKVVAPCASLGQFNDEQESVSPVLSAFYYAIEESKKITGDNQ